MSKTFLFVHEIKKLCNIDDNHGNNTKCNAIIVPYINSRRKLIDDVIWIINKNLKYAQITIYIVNGVIYSNYAPGHLWELN